MAPRASRSIRCYLRLVSTVARYSTGGVIKHALPVEYWSKEYWVIHFTALASQKYSLLRDDIHMLGDIYAPDLLWQHREDPFDLVVLYALFNAGPVDELEAIYISQLGDYHEAPYPETNIELISRLHKK